MTTSLILSHNMNTFGLTSHSDFTLVCIHYLPPNPKYSIKNKNKQTNKQKQKSPYHIHTWVLNSYHFTLVYLNYILLAANTIKAFFCQEFCGDFSASGSRYKLELMFPFYHSFWNLASLSTVSWGTVLSLSLRKRMYRTILWKECSSEHWFFTKKKENGKK